MPCRCRFLESQGDVGLSKRGAGRMVMMILLIYDIFLRISRIQVMISGYLSFMTCFFLFEDFRLSQKSIVFWVRFLERYSPAGLKHQPEQKDYCNDAVVKTLGF